MANELYKSLAAGAGKAVNDIKDYKSKQVLLFDQWWDSFPTNNSFTYENKRFERTRALRQNKEVCAELFTKILNTSSYTGEQIIEATKAHIEALKRSSVREGKNNLTFLQNSATYLRQKTFEGFMGDNDTQEVRSQPINIDI